MAQEMVEQAMEEMVPELDDLRRKRIFSDEELRQIVIRRRRFECSRRSNEAIPRDFLGYLKYEVAVECLRQKRSDELHWKKASQSDVAGKARMHGIMNHCASRWKGDKKLWYQLLDYCLRAGVSKHLDTALVNAVRFHPKEASFWLLAADRQLKQGQLQGARTLLQRGLRSLPKNAKLWGEFLRLEVQIAHRVLQVRNAAARTAAKTGSAEPLEEHEESPWAPAKLVFSQGLKRVTGQSAGLTASFLKIACEVISKEDVEQEPGFDELRAELRRALGQYRPGTEPAGAAPLWPEPDEAAATQLWELWWTRERVIGETWQALAEDVARAAPHEALKRCALQLGARCLEEGAPEALAALAQCPRAADVADVALAILEALDAQPALASALQGLLRRAAMRHPGSMRLATAAAAAFGTALDVGALAQEATALEPDEAARLWLLAGEPDAALLERLLRTLGQDAMPQKLLEAIFTRAMARGPQDFGAAAALVQGAAKRLWDLPLLRARTLAFALEAELAAGAAAVSTGKEAQQLSLRFEEVLTAIEANQKSCAGQLLEWWLRYRETAELLARGGFSGSFPQSLDLHWRAMRSVPDQGKYTELAHRQLQVV